MEKDIIETDKKSFKVELALFFILGLLLGVTIKTEAMKRITIGFDDYQLEDSSQAYDITAAESRLTKEAQDKAAQEGASDIQNISPGASCNL